MSDPRFRPLEEIASVAELRDAAHALRMTAGRARDYGNSGRVDEDRRAALRNRAAMLDRIAEWLDHQATACRA